MIRRSQKCPKILEATPDATLSYTCQPTPYVGLLEPDPVRRHFWSQTPTEVQPVPEVARAPHWAAGKVGKTRADAGGAPAPPREGVPCRQRRRSDGGHKASTRSETEGNPDGGGNPSQGGVRAADHLMELSSIHIEMLPAVRAAPQRPSRGSHAAGSHAAGNHAAGSHAAPGMASAALGIDLTTPYWGRGR